MVSRRYQQSPVFYDPTPARWPWVLGFVLLIGAVAAVLYFRPDLLPVPRGQLGAFSWGSETPPVAVATPDAVDPVVDSAPASVAEVSSPAAPDMTAAEVAAAWVERWNAGDYAGLYDLTSGTVQRSISRDDFVARYQGIVNAPSSAPSMPRSTR